MTPLEKWLHRTLLFLMVCAGLMVLSFTGILVILAIKFVALT